MLDLDRERISSSEQGRRGWSRDARRQLDERRKSEARPIARSRTDRLEEAARRLEQEHAAEGQANAACEAYRAHGVMKDGRRFGGLPKPYEHPEVPAGRINTTDHDSRIVRTTGQPARQGYNAQAAVDENQIIVAAEITVDSPDFGHLEPMVQAAVEELGKLGTDSPETVLADPGYWHKRQMENVVSRGIQVLIPPDSGLRKGMRPGWDKGLYAFMCRMLETERGHALYRKTDGHGRAGLRSGQAQPRVRPLPTTRTGSSALGMAISGSHPPPPEAPQPQDRRHRGLKGPQGGIYAPPTRQGHNLAPATTTARRNLYPTATAKASVSPGA